MTETEQLRDCPSCGGSGERPARLDPFTGRGYADDCPTCLGTGRYDWGVKL